MKIYIETCFKYLDSIENSLKFNYSNGPIEGINNFIKVLKRNTFVFRKFVNFRTRNFLTSDSFN